MSLESLDKRTNRKVEPRLQRVSLGFISKLACALL